MSNVTDTRRTCKTCVYYDAYIEEEVGKEGEGTCCVDPPVIRFEDDGSGDSWSITPEVPECRPACSRYKYIFCGS